MNVGLNSPVLHGSQFRLSSVLKHFVSPDQVNFILLVVVLTSYLLTIEIRNYFESQRLSWFCVLPLWRVLLAKNKLPTPLRLNNSKRPVLFQSEKRLYLILCYHVRESRSILRSYVIQIMQSRDCPALTVVLCAFNRIKWNKPVAPTMNHCFPHLSVCLFHSIFNKVT